MHHQWRLAIREPSPQKRRRHYRVGFEAHLGTWTYNRDATMQDRPWSTDPCSSYVEAVILLARI